MFGLDGYGSECTIPNHEPDLDDESLDDYHAV